MHIFLSYIWDLQYLHVFEYGYLLFRSNASIMIFLIVDSKVVRLAEVPT